MKSTALESARQSKIIKQLEHEGYYVVKLMKTSKNGIPDLIAIPKGSDVMFVEVKTPAGTFSELQKYRCKELEDHGVTCKVWTDYNVDFKNEKS